MVPNPPPVRREDVKQVYVSMSREAVHSTVQLKDGTWRQVDTDFAISLIGPLPNPSSTPSK